jgi:ABC-type antimicrobial peptide transport system permease subunit
VTLGLGIGAAALTRALSAYLFDTAPTDPATFLAVAVSFVIAAAAACAGRAWRATTVDPMQALRAD